MVLGNTPDHVIHSPDENCWQRISKLANETQSFTNQVKFLLLLSEWMDPLKLLIVSVLIPSKTVLWLLGKRVQDLCAVKLQGRKKCGAADKKVNREFNVWKRYLQAQFGFAGQNNTKTRLDAMHVNNLSLIL